MRRLGVAAAVAAVFAGAACEETSGPGPIDIDETGRVVGVLFEDRNGNGQLDGPDRPVRNWPVSLAQPGGGVISSTTTDTLGAFEFGEAPVGGLVIRPAQGPLGDTLELFGVGLEPFVLGADEERQVNPGVRLLTYTLEEARALDPGIPLFSQGILQNGLSILVREAHLKEGDTYLRITGIVGGIGSPGDSVRVRGRTSRDATQPVLAEGTVFPIQTTGLLPEPINVTTGEADDADGGALDAALVQIDSAEILEAERLDDDAVRVVIDDGSGELVVYLRPFLGANPGVFVPDTVFVDRVRGLLVPYDDGGIVRWRVQPRTSTDVRLEMRDFPPAPWSAIDVLRPYDMAEAMRPRRRGGRSFRMVQGTARILAF